MQIKRATEALALVPASSKGRRERNLFFELKPSLIENIRKPGLKIVTSIHQPIFSPLIQNFVLFDVIWKGRLGNLHEHWNVIRDKHDLSRFGDFHEKFFLCLLFFIFLFLFQPCPPFLWGRSSCLESIEIICKPNFPLNISLYKPEMDSCP